MDIFIDLDGPIIDVSEKYYRVYADILEKNDFRAMPKDVYWELKRSKIAEEKILQLTNASKLNNLYEEQRRYLLETNFYIKYDKLHKGIESILKKLHLSCKVILVTLRSNTDLLNHELKILGIEKYFFSILTSNLRVKPQWKIKRNLILKFLNNKIDGRSIMIGDTETDIIAGKKLGFSTVAILNGIRNRVLLEKINPEYIINSLCDIFTLDIFN